MQQALHGAGPLDEAFGPLVAAGKGVRICETLAEAREAVDDARKGLRGPGGDDDDDARRALDEQKKQLDEALKACRGR